MLSECMQKQQTKLRPSNWPRQLQIWLLSMGRIHLCSEEFTMVLAPFQPTSNIPSCILSENISNVKVSSLCLILSVASRLYPRYRHIRPVAYQARSELNNTPYHVGLFACHCVTCCLIIGMTGKLQRLFQNHSLQRATTCYFWPFLVREEPRVTAVSDSSIR